MGGGGGCWLLLSIGSLRFVIGSKRRLQCFGDIVDKVDSDVADYFHFFLIVSIL